MFRLRHYPSYVILGTNSDEDSRIDSGCVRGLTYQNDKERDSDHDLAITL